MANKYDIGCVICNGGGDLGWAGLGWAGLGRAPPCTSQHRHNQMCFNQSDISLSACPSDTHGHRTKYDILWIVNRLILLLSTNTLKISFIIHCADLPGLGSWISSILSMSASMRGSSTQYRSWFCSGILLGSLDRITV